MVNNARGDVYEQHAVTARFGKRTGFPNTSHPTVVAESRKYCHYAASVRRQQRHGVILQSATCSSEKNHLLYGPVVTKSLKPWQQAKAKTGRAMKVAPGVACAELDFLGAAMQSWSKTPTKGLLALTCGCDGKLTGGPRVLLAPSVKVLRSREACAQPGQSGVVLLSPSDAGPGGVAVRLECSGR